MKLVIRTVIGIALIAATAGVAGLMLDPESKGTASVEIARPPEKVWEVLGDISRIPEWLKDYKAARKLSDRPLRYQFDSAMGPVDYEVTAAEPPRRIAAKFSAGAGFSGEVEARAEPAGLGTRVDSWVLIRVKNPYFRLISKAMDPNAEERRTLEAMKAYIDSH